jgi:hypothetical protein
MVSFSGENVKGNSAVFSPPALLRRITAERIRRIPQPERSVRGSEKTRMPK